MWGRLQAGVLTTGPAAAKAGRYHGWNRLCAIIALEVNSLYPSWPVEVPKALGEADRCS